VEILEGKKLMYKTQKKKWEKNQLAGTPYRKIW
jgi:hypothetical protein